jgi:hypothetical protein
MTLRDPDDETLMAYADGMLEPADRQRVERILASRPELMAKVEMFRKTSALIGQAAAPLAKKPVPDALLAAIKAKVAAHEQAPNVVAFKPKAAPAANSIWRMAMAASVAAIIGGFAGYRVAVDEPSAVHIAMGVPPVPAIAAVLDQAASGAEASLNGDRMKLVATFRLSDSTLCREFEFASKQDGAVVAVACKQDETWNTRFAVVSNPVDTGYAPASSHEAVEAYLSAVGAGASLTDEEEAAALNAK